MKANVFVVEGADGAGKTTFISRLSAENMRLGGRSVVIHNTGADALLPGRLEDYYQRQLWQAAFDRELGITTYIDRSFLSELVYGNLYRGQSRVSLEQAYALEEFAGTNGVVLVGLVVPEGARKARIEARGEAWDEQQPFVGSLYSEYFQSRSGYWIVAGSELAFNAN